MNTIEKDKKFSITSAQIRAGRALLGLTQGELSKLAGLGKIALTRIENSKVEPRQSNLDAIQRALEGAGVEFIPEDTKGEGVRFKSPKNSFH